MNDMGNYDDLSKEDVIEMITQDMTIRYKEYLKQVSLGSDQLFSIRAVQDRLDRMSKIKMYLEEHLT